MDPSSNSIDNQATPANAFTTQQEEKKKKQEYIVEAPIIQISSLATQFQELQFTSQKITNLVTDTACENFPRRVHIEKMHKIFFQAILGNSAAQYVVAKNYFYKKSHTPHSNFKEGLQMLRLAANQGHPKALFIFNYMHKNKEPEPINTNESDPFSQSIHSLNLNEQFSILEEIASCIKEKELNYLAKQSNNLTHIIGKLPSLKQEFTLSVLAKYIEVEKIKFLTKKISQIAENDKDEHRVRYTAEFFNNGNFIPKDPKEYARLLQIASDLGCSEATNNLARCYEKGKGVPKNLITAFNLYKLSAERNNPTGIENLAICYEDGIHNEGKVYIPKNLEKAIELYKKGVSLKLPRSQWKLAEFYRVGNAFIKKDLNEAIKLYRLSATQGFAPAQHKYGYFLFHGIRVPRDVDEGIKWFRLADIQNLSKSIKKPFYAPFKNA